MESIIREHSEKAGPEAVTARRLSGHAGPLPAVAACHATGAVPGPRADENLACEAGRGPSESCTQGSPIYTDTLAMCQ